MKDWKNLLDDRTKEELKELIDRVAKYRYAYSQADDVRVAQLWVALAEIAKDLKEVKEKLGKVEEPFKAIIEIGEEEKRKAIQRIVEEIIKPADKETQEVTRKLVDTLMKF